MKNNNTYYVFINVIRCRDVISRKFVLMICQKIIDSTVDFYAPRKILPATIFTRIMSLYYLFIYYMADSFQTCTHDKRDVLMVVQKRFCFCNHCYYSQGPQLTLVLQFSSIKSSFVRWWISFKPSQMIRKRIFFHATIFMPLFALVCPFLTTSI